MLALASDVEATDRVCTGHRADGRAPKVWPVQYTYRELMRVCQIAEQRDILRGAILFRDGDVGRECYIVVSGRMCIEKHGTVLATLHPSQYFGEICFLDHLNGCDGACDGRRPAARVAQGCVPSADEAGLGSCGEAHLAVAPASCHSLCGT